MQESRNCVIIVFLFQFEPVIQPGNEGIVHHMILYACHGELDDDDHGVAWDCLNDWMPQQESCYTSMFIWAVGGSVGKIWQLSSP